MSETDKPVGHRPLSSYTQEELRALYAETAEEDRQMANDPFGEIAALRAALEQAEKELAMVDEAIARRSALADAPNRYTAIYRACTRAGQADAAERALAAAREEIERLKKVAVSLARMAIENGRLYDGHGVHAARATDEEAHALVKDISARAALDAEGKEEP